MSEIEKPFMVRTVERVRRDGKYVEFWFQEENHKGEERRFDECCKGGDLGDATYFSWVSNDIFNNGWKGIKIMWRRGEREWFVFMVLGREFEIDEFDLNASVIDVKPLPDEAWLTDREPRDG
ncbi:hypothetical protein FF098_014940 [Parvularcula flava]|uniref:Uncharacterized protein n=1 Tax=Aquisalinus luteolus TaxID=1566827 RepID=A0A8J3ERR7_9PROT|nr:hypothetical protein [Aquisalinus luteolus]NHK29214.1 hypothetical protein [Aquisalinus luteolus]GGH99942.1 hypothetical protein GCM10011355_27070 [Aquisalinus luteolus]